MTPLTPITDEAKAQQVLLDKLQGAALSDIHICLGDDDHPPHITLSFDDMELNIIHSDLGLMAVLSQVKPIETQGRDFHHSPGVLQ